MGARTDQAERRVAEQRERISGMLADLERRVQDDVEGVRHNVSARASEIGSRATEAGQRASEAGQQVPGVSMLEDQVAGHPVLGLLGGFGTGVALGMAGGDGSSDRGGERRREDRASRGEGGSRLFDMLSTGAMSFIAGPLRDDAQTMFRQAMSGFLGTDQPRAEGRPAEQPSPGPHAQADRGEERPDVPRDRAA
ncbi:MAG: hypothetical protein WD734_01440 [Dehalococcoidia bacterium]